MLDVALAVSSLQPSAQLSHLSMPFSNLSSLSPLAIASALVTFPSCSNIVQHTVTFKFTAIVPVETILKLQWAERRAKGH